MFGDEHQVVLKLAREMVEIHRPSHREYRVARALLDMEERWLRLRWVREEQLNCKPCCNSGAAVGGLF